MRVKDHSQVGNWTFVLENPDGDQLTLPPGDKGFNRLSQLRENVLAVIELYDESTGGEYSKKQRELAAQLQMSFPDYITKVIEHQFCLRMHGKVKCWSDGVGDTLHNAIGKIDDLQAKVSPVMRKAIQSVTARVTPSRSTTFRGCGRCGGTKSFSPKSDNLGRAGKLNRK